MHVVLVVCGPDAFVCLHNSYKKFTILYGPRNLVTNIFFKYLKGCFLLNFFKIQPQDCPDDWLFTFKISTLFVGRWSRFLIPPIHVVSLVILFIIVVVLVFVLLFFRSFSSDPPWDFGPVHCSLFLIISPLQDHTLANVNKVLLLDLSFLYIIRWWC